LIKWLPYIPFEKIYLYFSTGNGQTKEPALCQLYRHSFVPYAYTAAAAEAAAVSVQGATTAGERRTEGCQ